MSDHWHGLMRCTEKHPPYYPFRCPTCSRYVGKVRWWANDERVTDVRGVCKTHGDIQLAGEFWNYDLLAGEDA